MKKLIIERRVLSPKISPEQENIGIDGEQKFLNAEIEALENKNNTNNKTTKDHA